MSLKPLVRRFVPFPVRYRAWRARNEIAWRWEQLHARFESDIRVEDVGGDLTCIAFSGLRLNQYFPNFEFRRTLDQLSINRIYVRDYSQRWYLRGIRRVPGGFDGACRELDRRIKALGAPAFTMGVSMGGYAALRFASRLRLAGVLAFGPQVFIDAASRSLYGDDRFATELASVLREYPQPPGVREELIASPVEGPIDIWCGTDEPRDAIHARLLTDLPRLTLHEMVSAHAVALELRNQGRLTEVVADFVARVERG